MTDINDDESNSNISLDSNNTYTIKASFDKKGLVKKLLEEDPELLQDVITEIRQEKINKLKE
jgi:hypothetical protein